MGKTQKHTEKSSLNHVIFLKEHVIGNGKLLHYTAVQKFSVIAHFFTFCLPGAEVTCNDFK